MRKLIITLNLVLAGLFSAKAQLSTPTWNIFQGAVCENASNVTYKVNAVSGASSYTIVPTGGGVQITSIDAVTWRISFGEAGFGESYKTITLSVRACNSSGCSEPLNQEVKVYKRPTAPIFNIKSEQVFPGQTGVQFTLDQTYESAFWWMLPTGVTASVSPVNTSTVYLSFSQSFTSGTIYAGGINGICGLGPTTPLTVTAAFPELNSITHTSFDNTAQIGQSYAYYDYSGRLLQSQVKANTANKILVSQPIYDKYGRAAGQTLTAPSTHANFGFQESFIRDASGGVYNHLDLEGSTPGSVQNTVAGTLGHYYSNNNSAEPWVPTTSYPFSRTEFYEDGSGEVKSVSMPGAPFITDASRKAYSKTFPAMKDLDVYMQIRNLLVNDGLTSLDKAAMKTVSRDPNGVETITYTDGHGNTLVTAHATGTHAFNMNAAEYVWAATPSYQNIDFHIPGDGTTRSVFIRGFYTMEIENLLTGQKIQPTTSTSGGDEFSGALAAGFYRCHDCRTLDFNINRYYDAAFRFYDAQGRLIVSVAPNGVKDIINSSGVHTVSDVQNMPFTTYYTYDFQGRLIEMRETDAGITRYMYRRDGSIRFSQNALQAQSGTFSYTNYDALGRPVESGEYVGGAFTFNSTALKGILESTAEGGGLIANYSQRKDWIRTYYDLADPQPGTTLMNASANMELNAYHADLSVVSATGSITLKPGFAVPQGSTFQATVAATPTIVLPTGGQKFLTGAVSYTENANAKTWYSYDDRGRVTWMASWYKNIFAEPKVIHYEYDFLGNVTYVKYQDGKPDAFYHLYQYDADKRLSKVYASKTTITAGSPPASALQATYEYYTHGPLKRVILGNNAETTDYYYTLQGWLKSINNPEVTGRKFAQSFTYFSGDYSRSGVNLGSYSPAVAQYSGNIAAIRSRIDYNGQMKEDTFHYRYDHKYQLTEAGKTGNNRYKESSLTYDANGNIQTLRRYNSTGGDLHNFTGANKFQYIAGSNKLSAVPTYATYQYNAIGAMSQLIRGAESWKFDYDVTGKVKAVNNTSNAPLYRYEYDDRGFRIRKTDLVNTNPQSIYVRDASGSILAIYTSTGVGEPAVTEYPVYGSGRLGSYYQGISDVQYELKDHLGNVRALVRRSNAQATYFANYYPFGLEMQTSGTPGRYGYQGEFAEKDAETGFNHFEARMYDPLIGRWMTVDPNRQFWSPYNGMGNNPISGLDSDGRDVILLNAPNGAGGFGHVGMLVGSAGNWRYISKEGTDFGFLGPGNELTNKILNDKPVFGSVQAFLNSEYNEHGRYHSGIYITTDAATDAAIIEQGDKGLGTWYDLMGSNCLQNCIRPLVNQNIIPSYLGSEFLPNKTYWKIFDHEFENSYDFINFQNFHFWQNFTLFYNGNLPQGTIEVQELIYLDLGKIKN